MDNATKAALAASDERQRIIDWLREAANSWQGEGGNPYANAAYRIANLEHLTK